MRTRNSHIWLRTGSTIINDKQTHCNWKELKKNVFCKSFYVTTVICFCLVWSNCIGTYSFYYAAILIAVSMVSIFFVAVITCWTIGHYECRLWTLNLGIFDTILAKFLSNSPMLYHVIFVVQTEGILLFFFINLWYQYSFNGFGKRMSAQASERSMP